MEWTDIRLTVAKADAARHPAIIRFLIAPPFSSLIHLCFIISSFQAL